MPTNHHVDSDWNISTPFEWNASTVLWGWTLIRVINVDDKWHKHFTQTPTTIKHQHTPRLWSQDSRTMCIVTLQKLPKNRTRHVTKCPPGLKNAPHPDLIQQHGMCRFMPKEVVWRGGRDHSHENQGPGFSTRTLYWSHDQRHSLHLSVVLMLYVGYARNSCCCFTSLYSILHSYPTADWCAINEPSWWLTLVHSVWWQIAFYVYGSLCFMSVYLFTCISSVGTVFSVSLQSLAYRWSHPTFCQVKHLTCDFLWVIFYIKKKKSYHTLFFLFICHTVCFDKMNIPTELTPIWRGWHEADGCSSYVERCYRRLTVKSCYLNRVACWHRVACWLLRLHTRESDSAKATDIKLRMTSV